MSSRRGRKQPFVGPSNSLTSKGKGTSPYGYSSQVSGGSNTNTRVDQLSHDMTKISINSTQDGGWEVYSKKSKNRASGNAKPWPAQSFTPNAWSHPNVVQKLGLNDKARLGKQTGLDWQAKDASGYPNQVFEKDSESDIGQEVIESDIDDDDDLVEDDDDLMSDDFDSDVSVKSHETRKNHKWFKSFFKELNKLAAKELNEASQRLHCPACKNGPGAITWYRGIQPLMAHAKTKGSKRVKLHREFAELLDEELIRKGISTVSVSGVFGKWEGLPEAVPDREIIWPPMVVIMNTRLTMDENDEMWIGMGNQELLDSFSSYEKAVKARHSYGPKGHRGMSILIFETSAVGYLEAERLDKDLADQGTGRIAWDIHGVTYKPGGKRQLYGYMARKDDLDNFNQHCQGKSKLKFELRSYQEMVVGPMKQMSEDNQQLVWLKNKVVKEQRHSKALELSLGVTSQKLRKTLEENRIVRERTKLQRDQNKEEMDYQEEFFRNQINMIQKALEDKERSFEEQLQEERNKIKQSTADSTTQEEENLRLDEIAGLIQMQAKGVQEFEEEREKLIKSHEDAKAEMKRRHREEQIELEKEFANSLTKLMERYIPDSPEEDASGS